jgi:hypothetical protein
MLHELTHVLTWDEKIDHGPEFRATRKALAHTHWPGVAWEPITTPGRKYAYQEDHRIVEALIKQRPDLSKFHARYEVEA